MSTAASVQTPIAATEEERPQVARVAQFLVERLATPARLVGADGEEIALPDVAVRALALAMQLLSVEQSIVMWPVYEELTTDVAADLLNVSHDYLVQLLETGALPFIEANGSRRVRVGDLLLYMQDRDARRRAALQRLTELSEDLGLYE